MPQELGGDTGRAVGPGWPKGWSTPGGVVLSNKTVVKKEEGGTTGSDGTYLTKEPLPMMSPAVLEAAELLPADGR